MTVFGSGKQITPKKVNIYRPCVVPRQHMGLINIYDVGRAVFVTMNTLFLVS